MRLVIQRSREGTGTDTRYILTCRLEVSPKERQRLDAIPSPRWHRALIECGIDHHALMNQGYRVPFNDVLEAKKQEADLREAFEAMLMYFEQAQAYGGNDVIEANLDALIW